MNAQVVIQAVAALCALTLYFLPAVLADRRKRHDVLTLALFNACLGWTVFGWLLALYWSLQPNPPKNIAGDVVQNRKVVRMRAFSSALLARVQRRATATDRSQK
ncbi:superinfection immunity protein [Paraburkholderia sp. BCC1886]|uniref:superinfection immunity protein n=1 Tax=Paraburkholderia sp. BCC1886 TaxID=2562670 RepID=UPI0011843CCE|nr:superinfection immunity protein [Paraburkholderia sp. BCC1886]